MTAHEWGTELFFAFASGSGQETAVPTSGARFMSSDMPRRYAKISFSTCIQCMFIVITCAKIVILCLVIDKLSVNHALCT